jgi:hypothetical protein
MELDKNTCKVLSDLLSMADEHFGNHMCNDYELPNTPENRELMEKAERWNSEEQWLQEGLNISSDYSKIYTQDHFLMGYFAHLLKQE